MSRRWTGRPPVAERKTTGIMWGLTHGSSLVGARSLALDRFAIRRWRPPFFS